MKSMMEHVLGYASRGWYVFPIMEGHKDRPLVNWGAEATRDPDVIRRWWTTWPRANIGLACKRSGLGLVDLDLKKGKNGLVEWEAMQMEHGDAGAAPVADTPSGGQHWYFAGELGTTQNVGGHAGVDTRGSGGWGGYVLLPPSRLDCDKCGKGSYNWCRQGELPEVPGWLAGMARVRKERQKKTVDAIDLDQEINVRWAVTFLERDARPAVEGEGGDNRTFMVACTLRERGISEGLAYELMSLHYNPRCEPPWHEEALRQKAENAYAYASVSAPGGDTAEAHFGSARDGDFGWAGPPPDPPKMEDRPLPRYDGLMDEWVYIGQQQFFMRRRDKTMLNAGSFEGMYGWAAEKGKITEQIAKNRHGMRKFMTVAFLPGEQEFTGELYNTWRRPTIRPRRGDIDAWLRHLEHVVPDERERLELVRWMAWVLQNEKLKPMYALLMQGFIGSGKSIIGLLMKILVGPDNTTELRTEDVGSRFNSWIIKTRLAIVEELLGDEKRQLANRMKALITQDRVPVELKGKDLMLVPNKAAFMCFTNHDDALTLERNDRRYLTIISPAPPGEKMGKAFFDPIWSFARSDSGPPALMHHLLEEVVVDRDHCLGQAPATRARETMRERSLGETETWILEQFRMRGSPFDRDLVAFSDIEDAMPQRLRRGPLQKVTGMCLRNELRAVDLGPHRLGGVGQRRLWAVHNHKMLEGMSGSKRSERYLKGLAGARTPGVDEESADPLG